MARASGALLRRVKLVGAGRVAADAEVATMHDEGGARRRYASRASNSGFSRAVRRVADNGKECLRMRGAVQPARIAATRARKTRDMVGPWVSSCFPG